MSKVKIYAAGGLGDYIAKPVTIEIAEPIDNLPAHNTRQAGWSREECMASFDAQAEQLFVALRDALPGGTLDRLVIKLLTYTASTFNVSHEQRKD